MLDRIDRIYGQCGLLFVVLCLSFLRHNRFPETIRLHNYLLRKHIAGQQYTKHPWDTARSAGQHREPSQPRSGMRNLAMLRVK